MFLPFLQNLENYLFTDLAITEGSFEEESFLGEIEHTETLPTISTYPVNFTIWYYVIGLLFALISTFFAGYLPSLKARKIDPVEIIRGQ